MTSLFKKVITINSWLFVSAMLLATMLVSCTNGKLAADAFGNFETGEVLVSAEESGRLLQLSISEGDYVQSQVAVGCIDTTILVIKRSQLLASRQALETKLNQISKNAAVQKVQIELLQKELERAQKLAANDAITAQNFDKVEGEERIARGQLEQILTQTEQVRAEQKVIDAQIEQINEQIRRSVIRSPIAGTVLQKYAEEGELVAAGKPLFKVANLNDMYLRAYISGSQLAEIVIGQEVTVRFDKGSDDFYEASGVVSWVASSAEFTPKIIQTKDERVDLVYAIKVKVENNGQIKIGMPGEVIFKKLSHD